MTYFPQEPKKLEQKLKKDKSIGPGSYGQQNNKSPTHSYAPFGALTKKNAIVKKQQNQNGLGPGTYQINRELVKPSISKFQNQKCIIIKINNDGGPQFKSKMQRFSYGKGEVTPGPGSYESGMNPPLNNKKRTKSVGAVVTKMKELFNEQYTNQRKPTLFTDPIQTHQTDGKSFDHKSKGIVKWHLNQRQRFKSQPKELMRTEDQTQIIEKIGEEKKKQKNNRNSSFFASTSVKSCFDQIVYKTTNPLKIEVRKMMGFNDESPGPGSYNLEVIKENQNKKKGHKYQFFGSTAERFKTEPPQSYDIGPGEYYSSEKLKKATTHLKIKKPIHEKKKNEEDLQDTYESASIGPGSYNCQKKKLSSYNTKLLNGEGTFGSSNPRFNTHKKSKQNYNREQLSFMASEDIERKQKIEEAMEFRKKMLQNKPHPSFHSETKRNCFEDYSHHEKIPFGLYEIGTDDISTKLERKKQYEKQIAECNLSKPGFLSTVQRFAEQKEEVPQHKDCWCQIRQVEKRSIEHMSPVFQSKSKRAQIFSQKNNGPGVGSYSKEGTLIKQSFNSRFIKQNQNKSKKIKLWKDKRE